MGPVDAYLLVLFASAVTSYVLTPVVLKLSRRLGAVDVPDDRKVHAVPTPTLGGVAIFAAFLVGLVVASLLGTFRGSFQLSWPPSELVAIFIGAFVIFALGLIDDLRGL